MLNNENKKIYHQLKEISIVKTLRGGMLAGHICRILSPYFSVWFIKHKVIPNKITILMIIFGIVGSIFFILPYVWSKIVGYLFWFLWFTMDLSDGEVARYTKQFSKYGTEMDYMAHLIDHPFMNIALWLTFLSQNRFNPNFLALIFIVSISVELVNRNLTAFQYFHNISKESNIRSRQNSLIKYFLIQIVYYPNMIVLFSPFVIVGWYLDIPYFFYAYIAWVFYGVILFIRQVCNTILEFYK